MGHSTKSTHYDESMVDLLIFGLVILLIFTGFILSGLW